MYWIVVGCKSDKSKVSEYWRQVKLKDGEISNMFWPQHKLLLFKDTFYVCDTEQNALQK